MKNKPSYLVWHEGFHSELVLITRPTDIWKDVPRAGIFLRDDLNVSTFPSRKAARAAIKRSIEYHSARPGKHSNPADSLANGELYHIARVRAEGAP